MHRISFLSFFLTPIWIGVFCQNGFLAIVTLVFFCLRDKIFHYVFTQIFRFLCSDNVENCFSVIASFLFQASFNRDRETGLNTMDHKILSRHELTIEGNPVSMIAVELNCKYKVTPWCDN